jgi:hypothetical protein
MSIKYDNSINFYNNSESQKILLCRSNKVDIRRYHLHCNASEKAFKLVDIMGF